MSNDLVSRERNSSCSLVSVARVVASQIPRSISSSEKNHGLRFEGILKIDLQGNRPPKAKNRQIRLLERAQSSSLFNSFLNSSRATDRFTFAIVISGEFCEALRAKQQQILDGLDYRLPKTPCWCWPRSSLSGAAPDCANCCNKSENENITSTPASFLLK